MIEAVGDPYHLKIETSTDPEISIYPATRLHPEMDIARVVLVHETRSANHHWLTQIKVHKTYISIQKNM